MTDKSNAPLPPELVEQILEALSADGLPAPSAGLRARVLERIAHEESHPPGITVRGGEGAWTPLLEGVEMKVLRDDGRTRTWLARLAKGAALPAHEHPDDEECFVIEGCIEIGGELFRAGDYQIARAGTRHGALVSPSGCVLLLRSPSAAAHT